MLNYYFNDDYKRHYFVFFGEIYLQCRIPYKYVCALPLRSKQSNYTKTHMIVPYLKTYK